MNNLLIIQKIQTSVFRLSTEKAQHRKGGIVQDQRLKLSAWEQHPRGAQLNHQDNFLLTFGFGLVDKTVRGGLEVKLRINPLNKQLLLPMEFPPPHETSPLRGHWFIYCVLSRRRQSPLCLTDVCKPLSSPPCVRTDNNLSQILDLSLHNKCFYWFSTQF